MLAFPLTFVLTDVLNEFYGPPGPGGSPSWGWARRSFAFTGDPGGHRPAHQPRIAAAGDRPSTTVFGWSARLYVASLTAYMLGQLLDITLFGLFRRLTRHRMLWLRATGSTLASQLLDTVVVNVVLLGGPQAAGLHRQAWSRDSYVLKIVIAVALTPAHLCLHALVLRTAWRLAKNRVN